MSHEYRMLACTHLMLALVWELLQVLVWEQYDMHTIDRGHACLLLCSTGV